MIHRLTEKDTEARTAVCSVDGPVRIYQAGRGWVCATKQRRITAGARRGFRRPGNNPHVLTAVDDQEQLAMCRHCNRVVDIVPWGRGWICSSRAAELGRVEHQKEPQRACRDCLDDDGTWVNLEDGECPRCGRSLNQQLLDLAATERELERADVDAMSFSIVGQWINPYQMLPYETAVPGWKTIGSDQPVATAV